MKKSICTLSFILTFISAYSQLMDLPGEYIRQKVVGNNLPDNVKGSPYFNEAFVTGTIFTNDNKSFKALLRYNAYNDEMQMKQNGNIIALLKFEGSRITLNGETFEVYNYTDKSGANETAYFVNLSKPGKAQLLVHKRKKYVEGTKSETTYGVDAPATFRDEISYFLYKNDELNLLKLSKKNILKSLDDKNKELNNHISDNKLKFKKDHEPYIKLIDFYNNL